MDFLLDIISPRQQPAAATPPPSPTAPAADTFTRSLAERRSLLPQIISETPTALMGTTPLTAATPSAPLTSSPPATQGAVIPAADMAPIELSPLGAEMAATLAMAAAAAEATAEAAALRAIIQDLKHAALLAVRDAENAQLRRDMVHLQALHAQRMQSDADLQRAQQAAIVSSTIMPPASGDAAVAKPSDAAAIAKLVNGQLGTHITPAIAAANLLDDESSVEDISRFASRILGAAAVVRGGKQYQLAVAKVLGLSGQHAIADLNGLLQHEVQDILAACRNVDDAGLTMDNVSIADSDSSSSRSTASEDIFTGPDAMVNRAVYQNILLCVAGGKIPHEGMATWPILDNYMRSYFITALEDGDGSMLTAALKQGTFLGAVAAALFIARHGPGPTVQRNFRILLEPAAYTNRNGTLVGVKPTSVMFKLARDLDERMAAMLIVQQHSMAFVCDVALRSFPVGVPGSSVATALDNLRQKLNVAATNDSSLQEMRDIIHTAIAKLGTNEPTGDMVVPSLTSTSSPGSTSASSLQLAASATHIGGKGGKGRGKGHGGQDAAAIQQGAQAYQPRVCLDGAKCKNYGTMEGCSFQHNDADRLLMQQNLGPNFVSRADKRLIGLIKKHATTDASSSHIVPPVAAQHGPRNGGDVTMASKSPLAELLPAHTDHAKAMQTMLKAALVPPNAPQPAAPQQVPAAESTQETRSQQAREYLDILKKAQREFSGCALTVPIVPPGHVPVINNFYFTMPINSTPSAAAAGDTEANTQAERAAVIQQSVPILQADSIAAIIGKLTPVLGDVCFGDFPACKTVLQQSAQCHTGDFRGNTYAGVTITSPAASDPCAAPGERDSWIGDAQWGLGIALRPCEYHRLEQTNHASASRSNERMQLNCFHCPYSLPRHMAEGSRNSRCGNGKYPCGCNGCTGTRQGCQVHQPETNSVR